MQYRDIYGKMWDYTLRQWKNLGLQFETGNSYLKPNYVIECLKENGRQMGYMLMFVQIAILKGEIVKGNDFITSGLRPEFLYDKWTLRTVMIQKYITDIDGNIKASILKQPQTHLFNIYRNWMKQLVSDIYKNIGRYEHRNNSLDEKTVYLEPQHINDMIDDRSENWIIYWVFESDTVGEEDDKGQA